jgi:hypothetical protein
VQVGELADQHRGAPWSGEVQFWLVRWGLLPLGNPSPSVETSLVSYNVV